MFSLRSLSIILSIILPLAVVPVSADSTAPKQRQNKTTASTELSKVSEQDSSGESELSRSQLMKKVYKNFLILQSYLHEPNKFKDEQNSPAISGLLHALNDTFHSTADFPRAMATKPGFAARLTLLRAMLTDAEKRFSEGKKDWVLWRLTTMSNHCISCHAAHNVSIAFDGETMGGLPTDPYRRGDFFLATRQYQKSAKEFMKAALKDPSTSERSPFDALRKWLFINVRINQDPQSTLETLSSLRDKLVLTRHQTGELSQWLKSLEHWIDEGSAPSITLNKAEELLRHGLSVPDPIETEIGQVEVLRALAILHSLLEQPNTSESDRRKALYYLGLSYSKIPMFFMYELPELYLEECIRSYPKTEEAKLSYKLYRHLMLQSFTGSSGAHIPKEEEEKSSRLHDFAFGS